jgi:hypothetical protein
MSEILTTLPPHIEAMAANNADAVDAYERLLVVAAIMQRMENRWLHTDSATLNAIIQAQGINTTMSQLMVFKELGDAINAQAVSVGKPEPLDMSGFAEKLAAHGKTLDIATFTVSDIQETPPE